MEFLLLTEEAGDLEADEEHEDEAMEGVEKSLVLSAMAESPSGKKTTRRPMFLELLSAALALLSYFAFAFANKPIFVSACLCGRQKCREAFNLLCLALFLDVLETITKKASGPAIWSFASPSMFYLPTVVVVFFVLLLWH